ncbi:17754_t:CDS:2 [Cetraspora pellucida]|uniref:17754_t:CDS:1 n=1 Tax=Cetraspora pellucida TaxID=1433469 RepID=A0A9N9FGW3_9GLOM|nr:17754_t:CDS:2 [Cetraspora pellucida]
MNSAFTNLDSEINLSEEMKSFSVLIQEKRQTKTILLTILQEIRGLNNAEDAIDKENEDKELIDEEMI